VDVIIASAGQDLRFAVELVFGQLPSACVVGTASEANGALALLGTAAPDVSFLDLPLAGMGGAAVVETTRSRWPDTTVVVVARDPDERERALTTGADRFVVVGNSPDELGAVLTDLGRGTTR
jgi:DNA-binding NarL/FixJ family response regulator